MTIIIIVFKLMQTKFHLALLCDLVTTVQYSTHKNELFFDHYLSTLDTPSTFKTYSKISSLDIFCLFVPLKLILCSSGKL